MREARDDEGGGVEPPDLCSGLVLHAGQRRPREQVDGEPDAAVDDQTVGAGHDRHGDRTGESAAQPCGERPDLDGKAQAMLALARDQVLDGVGARKDRLGALGFRLER